MTIEELHAELAKQIAAGHGWYRVALEGAEGEVSELIPTANGFLVLETT